MSNAGRQKVEEKVASPITQAIDLGVKAFEAYKEKFVAILCGAWERGPKSEHFDVDLAWRRLTSLASEYFRRKALKRKGVPAAKRSERLGKIAKVLGEACRLFDEANQDDLINDLHLAWRDQIIGEGESANDADPDGLVLLSRVPRVVSGKDARRSGEICRYRDD
jgi:hypothetical protein